jgi:hypothetical protein
MAKNTSSNAFRRIDVDQYAEDNYKVRPVLYSIVLLQVFPFVFFLFFFIKMGYEIKVGYR